MKPSDAKKPRFAVTDVDQFPVSVCKQVLPLCNRHILQGLDSGWDLVSKVLLNAVLNLGLREMEWLFLTCHNYWIICRLVSDDYNQDDNLFLAYSICSIEGSSEPFRAFLGAILSVLKGAPVQASEFNLAMVLDIILEGDGGSSPEDGIDNHSGEYRGSSATNIPSNVPMTHSRATTNLVLWSPSQWFVQYPVVSGFGSTESVWKRRFDNSDDSIATKVVELQRRSDVERRQRLYNEFEVYLSLEIAYQSGRLRDRITPYCYGAFEGDGTNVLILGLCGDTLNGWDELTFSDQ
ncbi:hypothetical protein EDB87DRAFT_1574511 [Lactarius vividus]|nr:hypothetical protein EDB87DRAFT_1574511 [Lactarius vividus]